MNLKNHFAVRTIGLGCLVLVLVLALSLPAVRAEAASYIVNTTDDINDGACNAAHCSLREAIRASNASAGPDTIGFSSLCPVPLTAILIQDASRRAGPGNRAIASSHPSPRASRR
jgi:CSLREA domain-containing protein